MRYIVFDCETTGLSPVTGDRICEIGAVRIENDLILDTFSSLINPQREISYAAYMVNKITPGMLKNAPKNSEILPLFMEFAGRDKLVAYNACFDVAFLNSELSELGMDRVDFRNAIDIYALAKKVLPDLGRYPLINVAKSLEISVQTSHRALADAEVAAYVFINLLKKGGDKHLASSHLNYTETIKTLERAIKLRNRVRLRFSDSSKEVIEKDVYPCRIMDSKGKEFLEYEIGDKTDSIPLAFIEEVM